MLKKIGFSVWMFFLSVVCIYSIYLMYKNDSNYNISIKPNDIIIENDATDRYTVGVENVVKSIVLAGKVAPMYGEEKLEIVVNGNVLNIKKYVEPGYVLEKNAIFAEYQGNKYKAASKIKCIDVEENESGLIFYFLDYSKLFVEVEIPEAYAEEQILGREGSACCNKVLFKGQITYLDCYCESGYVKGKITYENENILLRPGASCEIEIMVEEKEDVLAIPLQYVIYSDTDDEYRVLLVEDNVIVQQIVDVGIVGNKLVEIISGVKENDIIELPEMEMSLKYYLENEGYAE